MGQLQVFLADPPAASLITPDMVASFTAGFASMMATVQTVVIAGVPAVMSIMMFIKAAKFMIKWASAALAKVGA